MHGIQTTVKQVKVFDSLPGGPGATPGHGYQVTEEGHDDDDTFTSVNSIQQQFPATYGYLRGAAGQTHDPFAELTPHSIGQSHEFAALPQPTSGLDGAESFTGTVSDPFAAAPTQGASPSAPTAPEFPVSFQPEGGFDNPANSFGGSDGGTASFSEDKTGNDESPVSYSRVAGVQQTYNTGGTETVVY